jgi:hypothetical protein
LKRLALPPHAETLSTVAKYTSYPSVSGHSFFLSEPFAIGPWVFNVTARGEWMFLEWCLLHGTIAMRFGSGKISARGIVPAN